MFLLPSASSAKDLGARLRVDNNHTFKISKVLMDWLALITKNSLMFFTYSPSLYLSINVLVFSR